MSISQLLNEISTIWKKIHGAENELFAFLSFCINALNLEGHKWCISWNSFNPPLYYYFWQHHYYAILKSGPILTLLLYSEIKMSTPPQNLKSHKAKNRQFSLQNDLNFRGVGEIPQTICSAQPWEPYPPPPDVYQISSRRGPKTQASSAAWLPSSCVDRRTPAWRYCMVHKVLGLSNGRYSTMDSWWHLKISLW